MSGCGCRERQVKVESVIPVPEGVVGVGTVVRIMMGCGRLRRVCLRVVESGEIGGLAGGDGDGCAEVDLERALGVVRLAQRPGSRRGGRRRSGCIALVGRAQWSGGGGEDGRGVQ